MNNVVPKLEDLPEWVTREPKEKKDVVAIKEAKNNCSEFKQKKYRHWERAVAG